MVRSGLLVAAWSAVVLGTAVFVGAGSGARPASAELDHLPVRWSAGQDVVAACTLQSGRPSWLTAQEFRAVVGEAAHGWNDLDARITIAFRGDCEDLYSPDADEVFVEVAWDFAEFLARPGADSIALIETVADDSGEAALIRSARIVLRPWLVGPTTRTSPEVEALRGLVGHEFGHVLGLEHSGAELDLM